MIPAPAELQAGSDQNNAESADGGVTTPSVYRVDPMTVVPETLRDPRVLFLSAEVRSANVTVDSIDTEISKHTSDMELAISDGDLPQDMLFSYSTLLSNLIGRGEAMLSKEDKNNTLVTILDNLSQDIQEKRAPVDDLRHQLMANLSPYREKFRKIKMDNRHLLGKGSEKKIVENSTKEEGGGRDDQFSTKKI